MCVTETISDVYTFIIFFFQTGSDVMDEEVAHAGSKGFIGCFSSVQYNHVAPLKAALLNRGSSLVSIRGHLLESNCGALADLSTSVSRLGKFVDINTKWSSSLRMDHFCISLHHMCSISLQCKWRNFFGIECCLTSYPSLK